MTGGRIFVVDDNPENLRLLTEILRGAGHEVRVFNSGRRMLDAVAQETPELLLLDVNMPDLDGYEVCTALKADPKTASVPVVFLSALDAVRDKVRAFEAGGVDYVTKPFQGEEVLARARTQLELGRLNRDLSHRNRELAERNAELERAWQGTAEVFSALADLLPGTVLDDRYDVGEKIGVGGFAAVYRGHHRQLDRPVAIKVLRPDLARDQGQIDLFRQEGVAASRLRHAHAVGILDSGTTRAGLLYLVMELLDGISLADEMSNEGPLSLGRCDDIVGPICRVLAEAHAAGILHRDVKPSNIFLHRERDGREVVKLVDFGVAKLRDAGSDDDDGRTTIGRFIGTPLYMAPERLMGRPYGDRVDTYGVGMTLYEMITGRPPFVWEDNALTAVILACISQQPQAMTGVPDGVAAVVLRALGKEADERPSVAELGEAFAAAVAVAGRDRVAPPPPASTRQPAIESTRDARGGLRPSTGRRG